MPDVIEHIHGSVVQHGNFNNRVYLMQLNPDALHHIVPALDTLAEEKGYAKIIAKIPADAWRPFQAAGYRQEALIPAFFGGRSDALFVAKYISPERACVGQSEPTNSSLKVIQSETIVHGKTADFVGDLTTCIPADADEMSALYGRMFKSYPFPIQDAAYLKRSMATGVAYFGIRARGCLVSLAAAEIDRHHQTVEMTDFATLPEWRKKGMAGYLLTHMEEQSSQMRIKTTYSIARAGSAGMNRVFQKSGYRYAGFLKNNTQISGRIESMIVWYKRLNGQAE
jgi:beta-lysine N6-acetyltransferase